jgi:simple sugar transport system ATP-binding protein
MLLEVEDLNVDDRSGLRRVRGVSFAVRAGEILGIAGVAGNGQSELLEALAGILAPQSGHIRIKGAEIAGSTERGARNTRAAGVGHVPEDRQRMGLVTSFEACESGILGYHRDGKYNGRILMDHGAAVADVGRQMKEYDVRPPLPRLRTGAFSGGNQQKIVLGREMDRDPDILLVGQPTRGVDIGAIEFIHRRLIAMRDSGKAVLLVSVELDEIMSLADRILVMFNGEIVGEIAADEADEQTLGLMMAGERQAAPAAAGA